MANRITTNESLTKASSDWLAGMGPLTSFNTLTMIDRWEVMLSIPVSYKASMQTDWWNLYSWFLDFLQGQKNIMFFIGCLTIIHDRIWLYHGFTPPKFNIDTKKDGLDNVYISFQIWLFWISMLNFTGVKSIGRSASWASLRISNLSQEQVLQDGRGERKETSLTSVMLAFTAQGAVKDLTIWP